MTFINILGCFSPPQMVEVALMFLLLNGNTESMCVVTIFRTLLVVCVVNEELRSPFCQRDVCQSAFLLINALLLYVCRLVNQAAHR